MMLKEWPKKFNAAEIAKRIRDDTKCFDEPKSTSSNTGFGITLRNFLYPDAPPEFVVSPKSVGWRLKKHIDNAVVSDDGLVELTLREELDSHRNRAYFIESKLK